MGEFKIYTKTGDAGQTSLVGGNRVPKNHERIEAYGTVDELNAFVGSLRDHLKDENIIKELILIQENLFVLGSLLAYDGGRDVKLQELREEDIKYLEQSIDKMVSVIPPLRSFILPGGHPAVSASHICRVVCRRAERLVINLVENFDINPIHLKYLNRLSDYFFILSRKLSQINGVVETPWIARKA
jgi:cob(I)alamin adenosyltransferase